MSGATASRYGRLSHMATGPITYVALAVSNASLCVLCVITANLRKLTHIYHTVQHACGKYWFLLIPESASFFQHSVVTTST